MHSLKSNEGIQIADQFSAHSVLDHRNESTPIEDDDKERNVGEYNTSHYSEEQSDYRDRDF